MFLRGTPQSVPKLGRMSGPEDEEGTSPGASGEAYSHGQNLTEYPRPWQGLLPLPSKTARKEMQLIPVPFPWTSTDPGAKSPHRPRVWVSGLTHP